MGKKMEVAEQKTEGQILQECLSKNNINQRELSELCIKKGYPVSQGSISKILSGKKKMSLEECRAFCMVFGISADKFIFPEKFASKEKRDSFFLLEKDALKEAELLVGDYQIFFMSTANDEYKILDGILRLTLLDFCVSADIEINVRGEKKKDYHGFLYFSSQWTVAYIVVKNSETGEISVLALRYRRFTIESMQCRIALCLTTSAGEQKNPVIHRMLLFRDGNGITKELLRKYLSLRGAEYPKEQDWEMFRITEKLSDDMIEVLKTELSEKKIWTLEEKQLKEVLMKAGLKSDSSMEALIQRLKMYMNKNYSYRLEAEDDTEFYAICQSVQKAQEVL